MNANCSGIRPNPDIAGIGVRVSVYIQAALTILPLPWFLSHRHLNVNERRFIRQGEFGLLLTTIALLTTAFIQSATSQLSIYHALIVLNLAWINVASISVCFVIEQFTTENGRFSLHPWNTKVLKDDLSRWRSSLFTKHNWMKKIIYTTFSLNITLLGAFGLLVWNYARTFGNPPECISQTRVAIFGHAIAASNPYLRVASLVVYSILVIPILNLAFLVVLVAIIAELFVLCVAPFGMLAACMMISPGVLRPLGPARRHFRFLSETAMVTSAPIFLESVFIIDTERMIRLARRDIGNEESQWTFGQTLAIALIALPISEVIKQLVRGLLPETHSVAHTPNQPASPAATATINLTTVRNP